MPDQPRRELIISVDDAIALFLRRTLPSGLVQGSSCTPGSVAIRAATASATMPLDAAVRRLASPQKSIDGIFAHTTAGDADVRAVYGRTLDEINTAIRTPGLARETLSALDVLRGAITWQVNTSQSRHL